MDLSRFHQQIVPMRSKLYRLALRITGSVHTSEDVVQEVFEKIWKSLSGEAYVQNAEAWAMALTRNLSIDKTRRKSIRVETELPMHLDRHDQSPNPAMVYESSDTMRHLKQLIDGLPEKQRTVLHLRDIEEYDFEEIAQIMEISLEDARVNLHRARKALREKLTTSHQNLTKS